MVELTTLQNMMIDAVHAECARYRASRGGECDEWCPAHKACRALPADTDGHLSAFISAYNSWQRMKYWEEEGFPEEGGKIPDAGLPDDSDDD